MLALILLIFAIPAASAHADAGSELAAKIAFHKQNIAAAKSLPAKLARLRALKGYLNSAAEKLPQSEKNPDERRRLIITTEALRVFFGYLNEKQLRSGQCELVRSQLQRAIDPRNDTPEYVPGEAREAFDVLALFCAGKAE